MKTLKDIIALRGNKYADDAKNPSYTEFWQGYFEGWKDAYRDLKEILEQNDFNLDVPVIDVGKTNAQHIRSMTDEELVEFLFEYGAYTVCDLVCGGGCKAFASLKETSDEKCRRIILEKMRAPYKEKEHGQTIGADTEA